MHSQGSQLDESIQLALSNALSRLPFLKSEERLALVNEYREWLQDKTFSEEVMILRDSKP